MGMSWIALRRAALGPGTSVPSGVLTSRLTAGRSFLVVAAAAVTWAIVLPAATYAASQAARSWLTAGAAIIYTIGSVICHQLPERSFYFWATAMPVCARCAGIYTGGALVAVAMVVRVRAGRPDRADRAPGAGPGFSRTIMGLAALPALASLLYEWTTGQTPSNTVRAVTGLVLGGGAALVILSAIRAEHRPSRTDAVN
jgi:uncharacterized membrane protein